MKVFAFCFLVLLFGIVSCEANNICSLPIVPGPCAAYYPRFAFDTEEKACRQFIYSGCGGNENNFGTLAECQNTC